jgi:hypothetical protein
VLFALTLLPILGGVALAIDVGAAVWARARLDLAADAAALAASMDATAALVANPAASLLPAQNSGVKRFTAQAGALPSVALGAVSVAVTASGGRVTTRVTYAATYTTSFAALFGAPTLPLGGEAILARAISPYFAIDIVMDNSSSMAIAATPSGIARLGALVTQSPQFTTWGQSQACGFGCHFDAGGNDFYGLAHRNGITLRIDVLGQAVQGVLATIAASPQAGQFSVGLMNFTGALTEVFGESSDIAAAEAAMAGVGVPVTTAGNDADTNIPRALATLAANTPAAGDGSTPAQPRRYVFIVTDGVADYDDGNGNRVIAPLDPADCAALKAKGIQIMTLYTSYIPLTGNAFYNANVAPFIGQVAPNLTACASSPSFEFEASDPAAIAAAMQAMLQAAVSAPARFTY